MIMHDLYNNNKSSTALRSCTPYTSIIIPAQKKARKVTALESHATFWLSFFFLLFTLNNARANELLQKAQTHFDARDYDQTLAIADQALQILENQQETVELGDCLNLIGRAFLRKKNYQSAFEYFQKALSVRANILGGEHPDVANCHNNLGICYRRLGDVESAIAQYKLALNIRQKNNLLDDIAGSHNNLGNCFLQIGKLKEAKEHFQKALDNRIAFFGNHHLNVAKSQIALAAVNWELGAIFHAKELYLNALSIRKELLGAEDFSLTSLYDHLGLIAQYQNQLEEAKSYHEQALKITLKSVGESSLESGRIYNNLGNCYFKKKDFTTALKYYGYAQRVFERLLPPSDPLLAECLNNFGSCYFELEDYEMALNHFEAAIRLIEQANISDAEKRAIFIMNAGKAHAEINKQNTAKEYYETALNLLKNNGIVSFHLPVVLRLIGELHFEYNTQTEKRSLDMALDKFEESLEVLNRLWSQFQNPRSLQILLDNNFQVFEYLVEAHFLSWEENRDKKHLEKIFEVIEKSKSLVWAEMFQGRKGFKHSIPNIQSIQNKLLTEERSLITWFFAEKHFYTFVISKKDFFCLRKQLDFPIREWISEMRSGIFNFPISGAKAARQYNEAYISKAYQLFEKLLKPSLKNLPQNISRLTLIPDGVLHYLPFDALLTSIPADPFAFKKLPYLLKNYRISYAFSTSQMFQTKQLSEVNYTNNLLSIAPNFENDPRGFSPLENSLKEVNNIQKIISGDKLVGQEASLQNFLEKAPGYRILHLATHGNADDRNGELSYLVFNKPDKDSLSGLLYVKDLYELSLPAELAVLSACETGIGEYRRGEGVISLASGISIAGVRSVMTTLWAVSDIATANLVESFFKALKTGKSKDDALRQAKLDFLDLHQNDKAHPFYWAGFVPMGEMKALEFSNNWPLYILTGVLLAVLILGIYRTFFNSRIKQ